MSDAAQTASRMTKVLFLIDTPLIVFLDMTTPMEPRTFSTTEYPTASNFLIEAAGFSRSCGCAGIVQLDRWMRLPREAYPENGISGHGARRHGH
jgi:hypothetical protein